MRQHSIDVWYSPDDHLSKPVLCRLLDQESLNMSETKLWTFVISWAKMECQLNNIEKSPKNIRTVIDDAGLLNKIRFLTFTKKDLFELVEPSGIISNSELAALYECIESINENLHDKCCDNSCDKCSNNNNNSINNENEKVRNFCKNFIIPVGFNMNFNKRTHILADINHCSRKILNKRKAWIYGGGTIRTKVTSQTHAFVIGFEVFTRIPSEADFRLFPGNTGQYTERLIVKIYDDEGTELVSTTHTSCAEFNASQNVKLSQPILFYPLRSYTVVFDLADGQYPVCQLSSTASCKMAVFRFEDFTNDYSQVFPKFSFISAVMCSL